MRATTLLALCALLVACSGQQTSSDPCLQDRGGCNANATCASTDGQVTCTCNAGFQGDGHTCVISSCPNGAPTCETGPACGNGVLEDAERCDDGNTRAGDGCSARCRAEPGWTCQGEPSTCAPICGDGVKNGAEQCDDGDTVANNGCDATCHIAPGYTCTGQPSVCSAGCGDGVTSGSETCDDGAMASGDGCSAACALETGWTCSGHPSVCVATCRDGVTKGAETCDDRNAAAGDGCSPTCALETGWTCSGEPSVCAPVCGDGLLKRLETCDDGAEVAGDGCSDACLVEAGWTCTGAPSTCTPTCGDGFLAGLEECDDLGTAPGDGCSDSCTLEPGWTCQGTPSVCATACGDGLLQGAETCDDHNRAPNDGCSASCTLEPGWMCQGAPSACTTKCGDGLVLGAEECDDHNLAAKDGCGPSCLVETGYGCSGTPSVCGLFTVAITSPIHGSFTQDASIPVTGVVRNLAPAAAALTINGTSVAVAGDGTFQTSVASDAARIFIAIRATLKDPHGATVHDRVTVISGPAVLDGDLSPQSVAVRLTDAGLDALQPQVSQAVASGLNIAAALPNGMVLVDNQCFASSSWTGCLARATVKVQDPAASLGNVAVDLDAKPGAVAANVQVQDVKVNLRLQGSGAMPSCDLVAHSDVLTFAADLAMEPNPLDPSTVVVHQVGNLAVSFTNFTVALVGSCNVSIVQDVVNAFLPSLQSVAVSALTNALSDPDGGGPLDGPIASAFTNALGGTSLTGPVSHGLGVTMDAPLFQVAEDDTGITLGANARFIMQPGTGDGQCTPPPGAPDLAASLALSEPLPVLGATSPEGTLPFGMAVALSTAGFNQLLKAKTECGMLVQSSTTLALGTGEPVPLTAGVLAFLAPPFGTLPGNAPFRLDVRPTLAPVVTGQAGPHGERTTLKMAQLLVSLVRNDATQFVALRAAVDVSLGLDVLFAGGALGFHLGQAQASDITAAVLVNPLGLDERNLETALLPAVVAQLLPSLGSSLASFPLPEFLGLTLNVVEVPHTPNVQVFLGLCQGSCDAPTCMDGVRNGAESDVDCGGPTCLPCSIGAACNSAADCGVMLCSDGVCGCSSREFTFTVGAMDLQSMPGMADPSDVWAGGSQSQGSAACGVTVLNPSGPLDLPGDAWTLGTITGFSTCFGDSGPHEDGCNLPVCDAPGALASCQEARPLCSSALGSGMAQATFTLQCVN